MTLREALNLALQRHQAGRLAEAETLYRQVLKLQPGNTDALHLLGVAAHQAGRHDEAIELIQKAIKLSPKAAEYHLNLGAAFDSLNRMEEAVATFQRAAELQPDLPEAHFNLGKSLRKAGRPAEAVAACRRAVQLRPDYLKAHLNLAGAFLDLSAWDEAIGALAKLISLYPENPEGFMGMAGAFHGKKDQHRTAEALRRVVELQPDNAEAHVKLAGLLIDQRQWKEAVEACEKALALKPQSPDLLFDLGAALRMARRPEEARDCFERVLAMQPDDTKLLHNIAITYRDTGQVAESIDIAEKILKIKPDAMNADSNRVYNLLFDPRADSASIIREMRLWNQRHALSIARPNQTYENDRDPKRRLRIGYVSPDFRAHVTTCFTLPLLRDHDPEQVEIFLYSSAPVTDKITPRFRKLTEHWQDVSEMRDEAAADLIRADKIDVLCDCAMHMGNNRLLLFARKPAPIQFAMIGYPGTTGLDTIDYRITDPYLDPPGEDQYYSEQSVRLADTFWAYDPYGLYGDDLPEPSALPADANGYVTFGCLNNFCKINDGVLDLWGKVLRATPKSRLLLMVPPGRRRDWVLQRLALHEVSSDRLELTPFQSRIDYLKTYLRIDVCLDTIPYNGHTTSLDSTWMGVPIVTRMGTTVVGRAGFSQLSNLKLTELVGRTDEEFVRIAVDLAGDRPRMAELRRTLRPRMQASPLMDTKKFAREMEKAYRMAWEKWCRSESTVQ